MLSHSNSYYSNASFVLLITRKDKFKAAHQSSRYGSLCWLSQRRGLHSSPCCSIALWQTSALRSKEWAVVWSRNAATMSYGCWAANDKATAQQQLTSGWGVCKVWHTNNPVISSACCRYRWSHRSCLFQQSHRFILAFIGSSGINENLFFFHSAQCESGIRIRWIEWSTWDCMACKVPAGLLNIVS